MASVSQDCPQRKTANPAGMLFCGACDTALGAAPAPASVGSPPPTSITGREAELRRRAVIFVDLIDSVIK